MFIQFKGIIPYNKKTLEAEEAAVEHIIVDVVEARLRDFLTYLAGEDITIVDLYVSFFSNLAIFFLFDKNGC